MLMLRPPVFSSLFLVLRVMMTASEADALVLLPGEMMSPPDARSPGFAETSGLPGEMMSPSDARSPGFAETSGLPGEMRSPPDARSPGFAETSGLPGEMMSLTHSFFLRASPQVSRCQVLISTGLTLVCTEWEMFIQQKVCSGSEPFALFLLILIAIIQAQVRTIFGLRSG